MEELLFFKNIFYCYLTWIITCEKIGWLAFHLGLLFYWFDNKLIPTQRLRLKLVFFNLKIFFNYIYLFFKFLYISNNIYVIKLIFYKLICRPWLNIKSFFFFTGDFFFTFTHKFNILCKLSLGITLCCAKMLTVPITFFFIFFLSYFESIPSFFCNCFKWPLNRFYDFVYFFFLYCYRSFHLKIIRYFFFFYKNICHYLIFWKYETFFFFFLLLVLVTHIVIAFLICFHLMFYLLVRNLIFFLAICFFIVPFFFHSGYLKNYSKFCSWISFLNKNISNFFIFYFLNGASFNCSFHYTVFLTLIQHYTSTAPAFFFQKFCFHFKKKNWNFFLIFFSKLKYVIFCFFKFFSKSLIFFFISFTYFILYLVSPLVICFIFFFEELKYKYYYIWFLLISLKNILFFLVWNTLFCIFNILRWLLINTFYLATMFLCFILATIPNDLWLALKKFYWCHEGPFFLERWVFRHVPNIFLLFWDFYDNYIVFALNKLSFPLWSFYVDVNDSFWAALPLIVVERISSWAAWLFLLYFYRSVIRYSPHGILAWLKKKLFADKSMTYWHIYIPLSNTSIRVKFYFSFILPYLLFMEFLSVKKTDIYFSEIEWGANDVSFWVFGWLTMTIAWPVFVLYTYIGFNPVYSLTYNLMLVVVTFVTLVRDCVYQIVMLRFLHFFDLKMYNITLYYQRFLSKVKYYFGTKRLYKFKKNEVKYVPTTNFHILEKSIIKVDKKTKLALKTAYCDFFLFCRKKNVK